MKTSAVRRLKYNRVLRSAEGSAIRVLSPGTIVLIIQEMREPATSHDTIFLVLSHCDGLGYLRWHSMDPGRLFEEL
jgi:hypothetical protein